MNQEKVRRCDIFAPSHETARLLTQQLTFMEQHPDEVNEDDKYVAETLTFSLKIKDMLEKIDAIQHCSSDSFKLKEKFSLYEKLWTYLNQSHDLVQISTRYELWKTIDRRTSEIMDSADSCVLKIPGKGGLHGYVKYLKTLGPEDAEHKKDCVNLFVRLSRGGVHIKDQDDADRQQECVNWGGDPPNRSGRL